MRGAVLLFLGVLLFPCVALQAEVEPGSRRGIPPEPFMEELKLQRQAKALRSSTVSRREITPPGYYDLSIAGDFNLGGAIFRNGDAFIHQDGGVYNTAVGTRALVSLTSGYYNVAFGYQALQENTSGFSNTAVGAVALQYNTTGFGNTALGDMTLRENTTGYSNTAVGNFSMVLNTTGYSHTAVGYNTLQYTDGGVGNTAVGVDALRYNTTGAGLQTAVGYQALRNNFGYENTAFGAYALVTNITGEYNVAIGSDALGMVVSGSSNIALGHRAGHYFGASSSNNITIGNDGTPVIENQTIRIGSSQSRAFVSGIRGTTTDMADAVAVLVSSQGQLGTVSSSRRYKEDIHDMAEASSRALDLRPVTFRYTKAFADGDKPVQFGLVAEEVAEVFPELVVYDDDGRPDTVKYHLLSVLLLNELQSLDAEVESRDRCDAERDRRLAELEAKLERLQSD